MHTHSSVAGFTLIELMISVAVVGFFSSIAYPSYSSAMHKARRSDAVIAMAQLQLAQERYRTNHRVYASTLADTGMAATSMQRHYLLRLASASATGYEALATATGSQASDQACRYLKLIVDGANVRQASGPDEDTRNSTAETRRCWNN